MENKIIDLIADYTDVPKDEIVAETDLVQQLGLSSLDLVNIVNDIEQAYGIDIPLSDIRLFSTVREIAQYLRERYHL